MTLIEEDVLEQIIDQIEYTIEDDGIGWYEAGDGVYLDKLPYLSLTNQEVVVQYPDEKEEMIYVQLSGYVHDYETDMYLNFTAHLSTCNWGNNKYHATYELQQIG